MRGKINGANRALLTVFPAYVFSNGVLGFSFQQIPSGSAGIALSSYSDGISYVYSTKCCVRIACRTCYTGSFVDSTESNKES